MKHILLVEDDPMLIDIYQTKLKEAGHEVSVAGDGEKATHFLEKEHPDIVILDVVLPRQDGWKVLETLKDKERRPKVVVLSNLGQKEEIKKGLELGADKYLIKAHFTPSQVVEEIEKLLSE